MKNTHKQYLAALASGAIFGVGLGVSGMTRPEKVIGFLDFFGEWDPSLAFVMVGAIAVSFAVFRFIGSVERPRFDATFQIPTRKDITPRLVVGSGLFGIGWGLAGFCPGPAIASIPSGLPKVLLFVAAMAGGMLAYRAFEALRSAGARRSERSGADSAEAGTA